MEELKSGIANGSVAAAELHNVLADFDERATDAEPGVRLAVSRLAEAGSPGTAEFLVAQTAVADACGTATAW